MESLWQDIRFGIRMLLRSRTFTLLATLSLAFGIGANTAIFSVVNAILLRPLPVQEPDRLVRFYAGSESASYTDYQYYRDQNKVFSGLAAHGFVPCNLQVNGQSERVLGELASANYFSVLGVHMHLGRGFLPEEDQSPGQAPVAVISYSLWERRFGARADISNQMVTINGSHFTIVGVTPPDFTGTFVGYAPELWLPIMMAGQVKSETALTNSRSRWLNLTGRVKPQVTRDETQADLTLLYQRLEQERPEQERTWGYIVLEPEGQLFRKLRTPVSLVLGLLMAAVAFVLLICCANVANLILTRAAGRGKEIAIRLALGASRIRIMRQLFVENALLSVLGGVLGLLLAFWVTSILGSIKPPTPVPIILDFKPDIRVLVFTLIVSLVASLVFGLAPALQSTKPDLVPVLKKESFVAVGGRRKFHLSTLFVIGQVAMSFVLLTSATLFIRSLQNASTLDPGFEVDKGLVFSFDLASQGYNEAKGKEFYRRLMEKLKSSPEVATASTAKIVPLSLNRMSLRLALEGSDPTQGYQKPVEFNYVGPGYFPTLGIPILRGREFTERDDEKAPGVAVVNETAAKMVWNNQDPIGKRFQQIDFDGLTQFYEVVGVARDSKYHTLGEDPEPFVYLSTLQRYDPELVVHLNPRSDAQTAVALVRREVQALDPNLPLDAKTMRESIGIAFLMPRLGATVLGILGLIGLVMSSVGVYGVIAYTVSRRTREIGIRVALGAQRHQVIMMVVRQGLKLAIIGIVIGVLVAVFAMRVLGSFLYGLSSADLLSFAYVSVLLLGVALAACYLPARRATRIDPIVALREE
jgi:putative ABC transport system permease protein